MVEYEMILSVGLGGMSFIGLISYLLYSWAKGSCSSHLKMGETELKLDINTLQEVKEVMNEVNDKEREIIKEQIREDLKKTLHKVKSRLKNRLDEKRTENLSV